MNQGAYIVPEFGKDAFNCPHCNAFSHQEWSLGYHNLNGLHGIKRLMISFCAHCSDFSCWVDEKLIYPFKITAPLAHKDMPESVLEYYDEARKVSVFSSRAAAALLRIAAKKLCEELGEPEPNLNRAIGNLGKKGLPETVIKSLGIVRIVGNEGGAQEGQIDLTGTDNKGIVDKLFWLINFTVEKTITEPSEIENTFSSLPENKTQAAETKNKKK